MHKLIFQEVDYFRRLYWVYKVMAKDRRDRGSGSREYETYKWR